MFDSLLHKKESMQIDFLQKYNSVRSMTEELVSTLTPEDMCVQPIVDISPPKWHLAHTTWFFEHFILNQYLTGYKVFHKNFSYLFNSYYNSVGERVLRFERGNMTRPTLNEIMQYRLYVNEHINDLFKHGNHNEWLSLLELGLNHEQQHQELLITDLKYILGHNPLMPVYRQKFNVKTSEPAALKYLEVAEGVYDIGVVNEKQFHFDNEKGTHKVFLHAYQVANRLVTNGEYLEFINENGYGDFRHWLADGWDWVNENKINSPMYWHYSEGEWYYYDLCGLCLVDPNEPVTHVSFYEADAYARWKGKRLLTEFEWETVAKIYSKNEAAPNFLESGHFKPLPAVNDLQLSGDAWQWTNSAYLPYPYYKIPKGAIGEYNGKFMINQMVLKGGSCATAKDHYRHSYRNFFQPDKRWQFTGIRLGEHI